MLDGFKRWHCIQLNMWVPACPRVFLLKSICLPSDSRDALFTTPTGDVSTELWSKDALLIHPDCSTPAEREL